MARASPRLRAPPRRSVAGGGMELPAEDEITVDCVICKENLLDHPTKRPVIFAPCESCDVLYCDSCLEANVTNGAGCDEPVGVGMAPGDGFPLLPQEQGAPPRRRKC